MPLEAEFPAPGKFGFAGQPGLPPAEVLRFLAHEAALCRDRDSHEMHVLLYPALLKVLDLDAMTAVEAAAFRCQFHAALRERLAVMTGADFPNV